MADFVTKDSGQRASFSSGMVRDTSAGKLDYTRVLDGPLFTRWAALLARGAVKYPDNAPGVPNWTIADGPEELQRFRESAFRHFVQWLRGDVDEDHAAAVIFNMNGKEYVQEKIEARKVLEAQAGAEAGAEAGGDGDAGREALSIAQD